MISCLFDYIGLIDATTPKSGVFINRLQGITTDMLDEIRSDETYNIEDSWDDIQNRAIDEFEQRIATWAIKYFDNRSYIDSTVSGQYVNENSPVAQGTNYVGWLFDGFSSTHKNMKLFIPSIDLYTTNAASSTITIFNAVTGDTLDTIPFSTSAGEINNITINKEYQLHKFTKIFIAYDDSEIQTIKATNLGFQDTLNFTQQKIPKTSTVIKSNMSGIGTEGQGMIINYNIACALDNFVCQRLTLFKNPFLYLLGYELIQEALASDRINHWTLLTLDRAERLSVHFLDRFNVQMDTLLKGLKMDENDFCFECDREINYNVGVPG